MVRNGHLPGRELLTGIGPVRVQVPKLRDRSGEGAVFHSKLVPPYLDSMRGQPCFVALQGEGREWMTLVSRESIARFECVFTDAMTFTADSGKRVRICRTSSFRNPTVRSRFK